MAVSACSRDTTDPELQSCFCRCPAPGVLKITLITIRKLHMERHNEKSLPSIENSKIKEEQNVCCQSKFNFAPLCMCIMIVFLIT